MDGGHCGAPFGVELGVERGVFVGAQRRFADQVVVQVGDRVEKFDRGAAALTGAVRSGQLGVAGLEIINPPTKVANRLGLTPNDLVAARRRVRYLDGEPFNINDSYYPYELVQGTEIVNPADVARGTNKALAELGYEQVRAIDEIEARMPLPDEATRLGLGPGNPVTVHSVTGYTADNAPVRHTVNVLIGSKHIILFERERPAGSEA